MIRTRIESQYIGGMWKKWPIQFQENDLFYNWKLWPQAYQDNQEDPKIAKTRIYG